MNPETLNWLLSGAQAFQTDPKLTLWNGLSRASFVLLLTSIFRTETFEEAVSRLEQIIAEGLTAPSIPPELGSLLEEWEKTRGQKEEIRRATLQKVGVFLETQKRLAGAKRVVILPLAQPTAPLGGGEEEEEAVTPDQERTVAIQEFIRQFKQSLQTKIKQDTEKARAAYRKSSERIARSLINFPQQEITPKDYQELLTQTKTEVETQLKEAGIRLRRPQVQELIKELASQTLGEATTLVANTRPLSTSVVEQLVATEEGVAFLPLYTLLEPTTAFSFLKKVALSPIVKTLQVVDKIAGGDLKGGAIAEWRGLLHYGLTAEDAVASITAYKEAGLPINHPVITKLEEVKQKLQVYQQAHPRLTEIFKNYHEFTKEIGGRQIYLPETRTFLPRLSQPVAWVKKQGYAWQLRQVFNKVGLTLRTHEKVTLGVGTTIIRFSLPDTLIKIVSFGKITNFSVVSGFFATRVIRPVLTRLGGTVVGQGIKKAASWALKRLGLAAIPTGVTQVMAVGLIALDLLKKLFKNPALLFVLGGALVALPLLLVTLPIIATIATVAGLVMLGIGLVTAAAGLVSAAATAVASLAVGAATAISGAIASLTAALTSAVLPVIAVGTIVGAGALTMVTLLTTSSAFVKKPPSEGAPAPSGSKFIEISKQVAIGGSINPTALSNSVVDNQGFADYKITVTAKGKTLTNIKVVDETSVTSKTGGTFKVTQDESGKPIGPWDQTNEPALQKLNDQESWGITYSFKLNDDKFKDSVVSNTVTVNTAEQEAKTYTLSFTIGSPPASSCPVISGYTITCNSYSSPTSGCHGTNSYWAPGSEASVAGTCGYRLGGYFGPLDTVSVCYTKCSSSGTCGSTYGFAIDVSAPPRTPVYLPSIYGKIVNWTFANEHASMGGEWGYGRSYVGTDDENNTYLLYLTHMNPGEGRVTNAPSGAQVGTIFNMSDPHVHVELRKNNTYLRPEFLCQ